MKIYFHLILLFILGTHLSCSVKSEGDGSSGLKIFPVIKLATDSAAISREYVGNVQAVKNVEIYARVKGYLEEVFVDEGQYVKKGQPLFRINDDEYNSQLARAKATLSYSIAEAKEMELEAERLKQLVDKQVISKTELEVALARLAAAKAKVDEAQSAVSHAHLQLNLTRINAPFDGIIDGIPYKLGSLIDEGTKLTNLSDVQDVFVYFNVSENEYLQYVKTAGRSKADETELILADGSRFPYKGKVETMEGQFNETTGSIAFRARFPNPGKILKHGSTGTIRLTGVLNNALLVPHKACFEIQDKNYVFVVDKSHVVKMRSFIPKFRLADSYVLESGLAPGEVIVYEGVQSIRDGMKIKPKFIDSSFSMPPTSSSK